jgi:predicted phosphate transport protein (TIGR00153 family)
MFSSIAQIFGKSPFAPLQLHMEKVSDCIKELPSILEYLDIGDFEKLKEVSKIISKLEHEADLTKNDIRNHLPSTLLMPIRRSALLEILSLQDTFADKAEDISVILTFRKLKNYSVFKEDFNIFFNKNLQTFFIAKDVINEFDSLLETSFGGLEAKKVKEMIDELAYQEHEIDIIQHNLVKRFYNDESINNYKDFNLWLKLIYEVGSISNLAEKLAYRIRMILELKE